jgi:hypothetical protein
MRTLLARWADTVTRRQLVRALAARDRLRVELRAARRAARGHEVEAAAWRCEAARRAAELAEIKAQRGDQG